MISHELPENGTRLQISESHYRRVGRCMVGCDVHTDRAKLQQTVKTELWKICFKKLMVDWGGWCWTAWNVRRECDDLRVWE